MNTRALQSLQAPEMWGKILHPQQLLLQSAGIKTPLELSDAQNLALGSLHTSIAIEMKRAWLIQPQGGLLSPSDFPITILSDGAGGFLSMVFP